ncbi:hypothetical protein BGW39_008861 [Mortierella sp. 14UC]|nr:hypothetical protein BGW39_008861 [Mortierella sp. 14UC]
MDVMNLPSAHIDLCPDAYLFEFKSEPGTTQAAMEAEQFKAKIARMKSASIRHEFGTLLNGISAEVADEDEFLDLMGLDILMSVTPLTVVSPPEQVQPRQNALVTSALNMTGVTRVHAELGLTGKGVRVGIIDTGIDYNHPALGGCFGPGCKVAFGHDFVGDDYTGKNKPKPSGDPMDCAGHGSHVAGIVAASDDVVIGVAPKVLLGAYRVLGCNGSSNDDIILAALENAVKDDMDIINLSIGEPNGWPNNPVSKAVIRMMGLGIMVTVSHGNENTQGLFSSNYVSVGPAVMAVASFINTRTLLNYFTIPLAPGKPLKNGSYITLSGTSMASPHVAGALALAIEHLRKLDDSASSKRLTASHIQRIYATFKNTAEPAYVFRNHAKYDILSEPYQVLGTSKQGPVTSASAGQHGRGSGVEGEGGGKGGRAYVESVAKQGSGMVNIYRALTTLGYKTKPGSTLGRGSDAPAISLTHVFPAMLELNDTSAAEQESPGGAGGAGRQTRYITISNYGPNPVQYELSHIPAEGLHELSIENKETKLQNLDIYKVTSPTDKGVDDVMFAEARATVEFGGDSRVVLVPGGGGQRRVAVTIFAPTEAVPKDQHWIYSGYIVVRAVPDSRLFGSGLEVNLGTVAESNPAGDYSSGSSSSRLPDAIHVSYAGVVGPMKTLPILLRPIKKELEVNNQTVLCQMLSSGTVNKTDFIYTFNGTDVPILTFCLQNPTRYLVMDLISAPADMSSPENEADNNNNDPAGTVDKEEYKVLGRVASNDRWSRNMVSSIVTSVQWDGMLELGEGDEEKGENKATDFVSRHPPGLDLVYDMRAKPEEGVGAGADGGGGVDGGSHSQESDRAVDLSRHDTTLLERRSATGVEGGERRSGVKRGTHNDDSNIADSSGISSVEGDDNNNSGSNSRSRKKSKKEASKTDDVDKEDEKGAEELRNDPLLRNKTKNKLAVDAKTHQLVVPNGRYRLRVRALRMLGDPDKAEGYDYWITRTFTIQRAEEASAIPVVLPVPTVQGPTP